MRFSITIILSLLFCLKISAQGNAKLVFAGEINLGNNYYGKHHNESHSENLFANVSNELKSGSVAFATLGTVLIDIEASPNKANAIGTHKLIRVPQSYGKILKSSGISALSLSNSHVADFGIEGLQTTSWAIRDNRIEYAGIKAMKEYTMFERGGLRYGFVSFGTSIHSPQMGDSTMIHKIVGALNEQCDIVVVAFNFDENTLYPNYAALFYSGQNAYIKKAQTFAHTCINMGADIVYGNGLKMPQSLELYKDRLVIYGLGRFCTPYNNGLTNDYGVSAVVEANVYSDGTFINGKILSYKQSNAQGPYEDKHHEALKFIKSQTTHNFPKTHLSISDNGMVASTSESAYLQAMKLLSEAQRHKGKPYRMGATGPNVFDCSGFTSYVFAKIGIKLLRTASAQYTMGMPVERHSLQPGDLVFFTRSSVRGVGHVGIVYSVDKKTGSFSFIHASVSKGITIDNFAKSGYYIRRYVGARRLL